MRNFLLFVFGLLGGSSAWPAAAQHIVTSRERGVLQVDDAGTVAAVLTSTPAVVGRMRDATHVVFLTPTTNELRELDLTSRTERVVATLPGDVGLGCGGAWGSDAEGDARREPYLVGDQLMFASSMAVDADRACFEVMDRNLNMASVIAQIEVDLHTGRVQSWLTFVLTDRASSCTALPEAEADALACTRLLRGSARRERAGSRPRAGRWTVHSSGSLGALVGPEGQRRALAIAEPMVETVSPDGRWAVIGGNREEGDYIYRSLWLLELRRGLVFPIAASREEEPETGERTVAPWPRPLSRRELADAPAMLRHAYGVTGETAIRWLGRTLVLGEALLVTPGRGSVALPGPLVR